MRSREELTVNKRNVSQQNNPCQPKCSNRQFDLLLHLVLSFRIIFHSFGKIRIAFQLNIPTTKAFSG